MTAPPDRWFRDLKHNGGRFLFADGWRKCFKVVPLTVVPDESAATALVAALLPTLEPHHHVGTRHLPAWDVTAEELEVEDAEGRRWRLRVFFDQGETIVHSATPA